jgi:nicotinamide mononucleotide adenylyltransferase
MAEEYPELDEMQRNFRAAVDEWVAAIRHEEALASVNHTVAQIDQWEDAARQQQAAGEKVAAAKEQYESALREKFFNF